MCVAEAEQEQQSRAAQQEDKQGGQWKPIKQAHTLCTPCTYACRPVYILYTHEQRQADWMTNYHAHSSWLQQNDQCATR